MRRLEVKDVGEKARIYAPTPAAWQEWLNRYIAAPDRWLLESIEPGKIVFVSRPSFRRDSIATFTYGPVP